MSSQKGNSSRTRPQKYQNTHGFKNDLHDKSKRTKTINSLQIAHVCERCKLKIEWKIKYKKYKQLTAPGKCNKCNEKTIKNSYHTICQNCAKQLKVCPKCGNSGEIVEAGPSKEEELKTQQELQETLRLLPERKRRTFLRYMKKNQQDKSKKEQPREEDEQSEDEKVTPKEMLEKLKAIVVKDDFDDLDLSNDDDDDNESDSSFEFV